MTSRTSRCRRRSHRRQPATEILLFLANNHGAASDAASDFSEVFDQFLIAEIGKRQRVEPVISQSRMPRRPTSTTLRTSL